MRVTLSVLAIFLCASPLGAQTLSSDDTSRLIDAEALEAYVDGVVTAFMEKDRLPGVTLSVVHDGQIVLLKGYGIAGAEPKRPVDAERSLFRVGSISKTFAWTALMQLSEQGLLSLDDPINDYLPSELKVPDEGYEEPIQIWHLMTHTPGFEDTAFGHLIVLEESLTRARPNHLAHYRPHRVRPPGDFTTYSNYGAALAGHIIANVSGMDFETYVEKYIYEPLGMTQATFREPYGDNVPDGLPAPMSESLRADIAKGLVWSAGTWKAQDNEHIVMYASAGSMSASSYDMARYMIAHLQNGELDGKRILDTETAKRMQQTLFANNTSMNGFAHGFMEFALPGGYHAFGHGGATGHFMSNMVMVPELDLGLFVSTNSRAGWKFAETLPSLVVRQYFGGEDQQPKSAPDFAERAQKYAGTYLNTRRAYTLLEKFMAIDNVITVNPTNEAYLKIDAGGESARWMEVAPHVFREVDGERTIAFREDAGGRISHIFPSRGISAGERIGVFDTKRWAVIVLSLGLVTAIGMATGAWLRRRQDLRQSSLERRAGQLMGLLGFVWLVFFALFAAANLEIMGMGEADLLARFPTTALVRALIILLVAAVLTIVAVLTLYPVWQERSWPLWRRLRHTAAVAILTVMVLTLNHWNLLGLRYL